MTVNENMTGGPVIVAAGEIDMDTTGELARVLGDAVKAGTSRIILDLSQVTFCDSTGLSTLVHAYEGVKERQDGAIVLVGVQPGVSKVVGITGLTELFEYHDTVDAAINASPN